MENWRLIIDPPAGGAENMATDEALLRSAAAGEGFFKPVLRLYGWKRPTVSIGCLQDASPFRGSGLPVVRRITGGRAVLHDSEITYSVVAFSGSEKFSGGISAAYSVVSKCIVAALKDTGVDARFSSARSGTGYMRSPACFSTSTRFEILAGRRKIAGSSQRRVKDAFLQHGSIITGIDRALTARVFGAEVLEKSSCLSDFVETDPGDLRRALVAKMSVGLDAFFTPASLSDSEKFMKEKLLKSRYSTDEWNLSRRAGRTAGGRTAEDIFSPLRG
ncbi:MAG: lipoate--protein ligase family protein [Thermodesulfobacteriota bacterium]|nr:MAG: lipoate--protein ligase family protein [Thermodesulfobacteriota bacterium]